jgi:hypothetical protein
MTTLREQVLVARGLCIDEQWNLPRGWVRRVLLFRNARVTVEYALIGSHEGEVRFVANREHVDDAIALAAEFLERDPESLVARTPREHDSLKNPEAEPSMRMIEFLRAGVGVPREPFRLGSPLEWQEHVDAGRR